MYQAAPHQSKKSYSWAGHCRFKVIDDSTDEEEEDYDELDSQSHHERSIQAAKKDYIPYYPYDLKCKKPIKSLIKQLPKSKLNQLKSIKETYVYLRNDRILENLKIRRPKYVHLYSHPLRKVSSVSAKKIKSLKNMKLLSLRNYGYEIGPPVEYSEKDVDQEEAQNGFLYGEDCVTEKELSYFLSNRTSLRRLYVMLLCDKWRVFKRLQIYARRQKNLEEFGFIADYGKKSFFNFGVFPHYGYNLQALGTSLKKLEIRCDNQPRVKIRGLDKFRKLRSFNCGGACEGFPSAGSLCSSFGNDDSEEESSEDYDEEASGNDERERENLLKDNRLNFISQVIRNPRVQNIKIKAFEIRKFDKEFWSGFLMVLEAKPHIKVTYEVLLSDSWNPGQAVFRGIAEEIQDQDYKGAVQILVLQTFDLAESAFNGGGLKTQYFNFDKQYLFEIRKYGKEKILSLSREASPSVSDIDIYNDIAFVGYIPGLH